jgi:transposase-like protein
MKETRKRRTTEEKLALVTAWKASGVSAAAFAKSNGLSCGQLLTEWARGEGLNPTGRPLGWRGTHATYDNSKRRNNSKPKADASAAERIAAARARNGAKMRKAMGIA